MPDEPQPGSGRRSRKTRRLELLRYRPGTSFLHRLDPRTKLFSILAISVAALLSGSPAVLLIVFLFELLLAYTSGILERFGRALTLISPLFVLVIVLDSLFSKAASGPVYFSAQIGFLHPEVTAGSLLFALAMGVRLLNLAGISVLFIMTTSHDDFIRSLRGMRVPPTLAFSLGYALRSTTALTEDTRQIMDAQRSRGLELDRGNFIRNRDKLAALFIPSTVSLLKRSKQTADAMQARGFRQSIPHSCYKTPAFARPDLLMLVLLFVLMLALLAVSRFSPW